MILMIISSYFTSPTLGEGIEEEYNPHVTVIPLDSLRARDNSTIGIYRFVRFLPMSLVDGYDSLCITQN